MQMRLTDEELLRGIFGLVNEVAEEPGLEPIDRAALKRWRLGFSRLGNPALNAFVDDFNDARGRVHQ